MIDYILSRRSIRNYTDKEISKENIELILKSAMYAPSAMNLQPWHFIVFDNNNVFDRLISAIPHAEMIRNANKCILVCGDSSKEKNESWLLQNCSASIQNVLLAAHSLGIGSCWIAIHGMDEIVEKVKKEFTLPSEIIPVALISLGYPKEVVTAEERFDIKKIHFNGW
jgi:nitroreductase